MLPDSSIESLEIKTVSLYQSGQLTTKNISNQIARLMKAFPELPSSYFDILTERIKANKFCDERLNDAINKVIDTCRYPKPSISDVVGFDKRSRLYSYNQVCDEVSMGDSWENYRKVADKKLWIKDEDKATK